MAKSNEPTQSDKIRDWLKKHPKALKMKPAEIAEAMGNDGVKVSSGLVYQVVRKATQQQNGAPKRATKKRAKKRAPKKTAATRTRRPARTAAPVEQRPATTLDPAMEKFAVQCAIEKLQEHAATLGDD